MYEIESIFLNHPVFLILTNRQLQWNLLNIEHGTEI